MNAAFMQFQRHGWDIHAVKLRHELVLVGRKWSMRHDMRLAALESKAAVRVRRHERGSHVEQSR
jgi:hypothetical protein